MTMRRSSQTSKHSNKNTPNNTSNTPSKEMEENMTTCKISRETEAPRREKKTVDNWLCSDNCEDWFHAICEKINTEQYLKIKQLKGLVKWECNGCKDGKKQTRTSQRNTPTPRVVEDRKVETADTNPETRETEITNLENRDNSTTQKEIKSIKDQTLASFMANFKTEMANFLEQHVKESATGIANIKKQLDQREILAEERQIGTRDEIETLKKENELLNKRLGKVENRENSTNTKTSGQKKYTTGTPEWEHKRTTKQEIEEQKDREKRENNIIITKLPKRKQITMGSRTSESG